MILHHMVNDHGQLDRTFAALVDPTRRAILARLEREDGASVSALAKPFAIKLPAVMKHLDVLDDAGLTTRSKAGRTVTVRLSPAPMRGAMAWLRRYERFWSASLDPLAAPRAPRCARKGEKPRRGRERGWSGGPAKLERHFPASSTGARRGRPGGGPGGAGARGAAGAARRGEGLAARAGPPVEKAPRAAL